MKKRANQVIEEIFSTKTVEDPSGISHTLDSNVDQEEGRFLQNIIKTNKYSKSIEIGCANGISSLFICDAIEENGGSHVIVDPFQSTQWKNVGIHQLHKSGLNNYRLLEKPSEIALPGLLLEDASFDFAFIDGWHTFDHTLLDMFYLTKLLKVGGTLVIDDAGMHSVSRAINYISNYPAYEFSGGAGKENSSNRYKFEKYVMNPLRLGARILPKKMREEIFSAKLIHKPVSGYSMVALKKIQDDVRPWNWFVNF